LVQGSQEGRSRVTQLPLIKGLEGVTVEPLPPDKPKRRYKQAYRPRKAPGPELPTLPEGAAYNDETGEHFKPPCMGGEGTCLFFRCRHNLVLEVLMCRQCGGHGPWPVQCLFCGPRGESGGIQVRKPKGPAVTVPLHRSKKEVTKRGDIERAGDAAADVVEWLEHTIGTTCEAELQGSRSQQAVALILRMEKQRVQQIEQGVKRNTRLASLSEEYAEEPGVAGFVPLTRVGRRG
jgi:hypothetical protein